MSNFGYAGSILKIDLSTGKSSEVPTVEHSERFLGGRGLAAKIYWDEVSPQVDAFDPENRIIFATGPIGGVPVVGGSRWAVCGKSAATQTFSYCNMGGRWGAELKFAGYDALVLHGKSDKPVYLLIDGEQAVLKDASSVWGKGTIETRDILKGEHGKSARVVAIGPAGENKCIMASFLADNDASGSGQLAASLGAKNVKAVVVKGAGKKVRIGNPDAFQEFVDHYKRLKVAFPTNDWPQISRWSRDLVLEFRDVPDRELKREPCYGCMAPCARQSYHALDGRKGKFLCHSAYFYQPEAEQYYGKWNDVPFAATKLCDNYGIDTKAIDKIIGWLDSHFKAGFITEEQTGLPLSKIGSEEFIETLTRMVALRQDSGDILAQGLDAASEHLLPAGVTPINTYGLLGEPGFFDPYGPRLYIMNGFLYAMEPTFPIGQLHEIGMIIAHWRTWTVGLSYLTTDMVREISRRFWGGEAAVDFSTDEGKAKAAMLIQNREYAKECLVICDFLWPVRQLEFTEDHLGDPTLESCLLSAVIGKEIDEQGLYQIGERVFNLQRAVLSREGRRGRESDCLDERCHTEPLEYDLSNPDCMVPAKGEEIISLKGNVVGREQWEKLKDEYYELREWDAKTGLQTRQNLESLHLIDVADDLEHRGLLGAQE